MSSLITHFYENRTEEQYEAVRAAVHPENGALPAGQTHHVAGPTDGGDLVVAVWGTKAFNDAFNETVLMPALPNIDGGLAGPPQERSAEMSNLQIA